MSEQRITVKEAAAALGISEEAVRQRIRRNRLESEKDGEGRVWVWLDVTKLSEQDTTQALLEAKDETITHLSEQLSFLRSELAEWQQEARRKDHLLATMMLRIPELEAASEPRESSVGDSDESGKVMYPRTAQAMKSSVLGCDDSLASRAELSGSVLLSSAI